MKNGERGTDENIMGGNSTPETQKQTERRHTYVKNILFDYRL